MAQHQDLCLQRGPRSEKSDQRILHHSAELDHRAEHSPDSLPPTNVLGLRQGQVLILESMSDEVFGTHRGREGPSARNGAAGSAMSRRGSIADIATRQDDVRSTSKNGLEADTDFGREVP